MEKTRESSKTISRRIVSGEHLNPNGTLFGGHLMAWVDEVAFLCARRFTGKPTCVTANIDNISFRTPIRLGEHIVLSAVINHAGRTSMEIQVDVDREDPSTHQLTPTNKAYLTFVCLDSNFKPTRVPSLILENDEDRLRSREARFRTRVRKRLSAFLEKGRLTEDASEGRDPYPSEFMGLNRLFKKNLNSYLDKLNLLIGAIPRFQFKDPDIRKKEHYKRSPIQTDL